MPTYEYMCNYCDEPFEVQATFAEKAKGLEVWCPKCANQDVQQVFGSVLVRRGSNKARIGGGCDPATGCCGPRR